MNEAGITEGPEGGTLRNLIKQFFSSELLRETNKTVSYAQNHEELMCVHVTYCQTKDE